MSSSYICATYFELTKPVLQNFGDKKTLGGIMFYKHLLFYFKMFEIFTRPNNFLTVIDLKQQLLKKTNLHSISNPIEESS